MARPRGTPPLVTLTDQASQARCPPSSPPAAECFWITVTGTTAGLGTVNSGGWFDVEAAQGSLACGQPSRYTEQLVTAVGTLTVRTDGPRLCAGVIGTVDRTYTVISGTGALRHVRGHGVIALAVLASGAAETWTRPQP